MGTQLWHIFFGGSNAESHASGMLQRFQVNDNVSTTHSALNDENWKMNNDVDDNDIAVWLVRAIITNFTQEFQKPNDFFLQRKMPSPKN